MIQPISAADLEPRKQVRLSLRPDLSITPQQYEGRTCYVVKDPLRLRYYRFQEREYFLMGLLDGRHTLEDAQRAFEKSFRPQRLPLEAVESFARHLLTAGLVLGDSPGTDQTVLEKGRRQRRGEWLYTLTNLLAIKAPLCDPDRFLGRLLPWFRWFFTPWCFAASVGVLLAAVLLVATHFAAFWDRLPGQREFFSFHNVVYLWLALALVKVLHEIGHGLSCKAFGGEVHEIGVLFLCLTPCLYCNVTDAWTMPSKWRRIAIGFAGIYVELMIAALATFIWWNAPRHSLTGHLSLSLMVVCGVSTVLFNANPLMRFDGYYVLADWLEVPNLRERANRLTRNWFLQLCLGLRMPPEPATSRRRQALYLLLGVLSVVYRWVLTFVIVWFWYRLFHSYKLGAIAGMLGCLVLGSMLGWSLYRLVCWAAPLGQRGRLSDMKPLRVTLSAAVIAAGLLGFFLVPLPVSRVRQTALVQLPPESVDNVYVPAPAVLERLYVRDGQRVAKGELLAQFRSLELETTLEENRSQYDIRVVQLQALRERAAGTHDAIERARIEEAMTTAAGERDLFARQVEVYRKLIGRLELRAPRAGVVLAPPRIDAVGKLWDRDTTTPFCGIGDPSRLVALVPVSPADYRLLQEDLARTPHLGATIRVLGAEGDTWPGKVAGLPAAEARVVPWPLTMQGGGPLAIKPGGRPDQYEPQAQHYLVPVELLRVDGAIYPGALAQVKMHCRWRSCAWWLWRSLAGTFDLGLI
jgi:putative peptide zinc metalloprotease protein